MAPSLAWAAPLLMAGVLLLLLMNPHRGLQQAWLPATRAAPSGTRVATPPPRAPCRDLRGCSAGRRSPDAAALSGLAPPAPRPVTGAGVGPQGDGGRWLGPLVPILLCCAAVVELGRRRWRPARPAQVALLHWTGVSRGPHGRHRPAVPRAGAAGAETPVSGPTAAGDPADMEGSEQEEAEEEEEWDPLALESGTQVVDIADQDVISLEELERLEAEWDAAGLTPSSPAPLSHPQADDTSTPGEGAEALPFLAQPPTGFTAEGFAIVTDAEDGGMEVMYTREADAGPAPGGLELLGAEEAAEWEEEGWTTGSQRGLRRAQRRQQDRVAVRRPALQPKERPPRPQRVKLPVIAVVGRPNVGKSTLVNRICDVAPTDGAIVYDEPGVTRDRTYRLARFQGYSFQVVDTGGLIFREDPDQVFAKEIRQQALIALNECKVAIVVVDGAEGPTAVDEDVARLLQHDFLSRGIAVYLVANKCEGDPLTIDLNLASCWSLGLGEPRPVSGIHGTGLYELLTDICHDNFEPLDALPDDSTINVAIVGRPNVGKSSILNRLLGQERAIVSGIAGTTRDTIDCELDRGPHTFRLVDTAGLRQAAKIEAGNEFLMANRTMKAVHRADVCLLVLDATVPGYVTAQDRDIAGRIVEAGVGCVILLNKWDAVTTKDDKTYLQVAAELARALPDMEWAPHLLVSAATGQRCSKIFDAVLEADRARRTVLGVLELNEVLFAAMEAKPPVSPSSKKGGRVHYAVQEAERPPRIVVYVNAEGAFTDNYRRYLEKALREKFPLTGSPVQVVLEATRQRDAVRLCPRPIAELIWAAVDTGEAHPYTALCS